MARSRKYRIGTFEQFKRFVRDVLTGKRRVRPGEPKNLDWIEAA
jgi:hypothetical protein